MFGSKDDSKKRFDIVYKENGLAGCKILVDKQTGVNYLYCWDGYTGGLTPLLDSNGTPVVTLTYEE